VKHKSSTEIAQILELQKQSGLSLQKFAVQEGIAFSTLQRWARKARLAATHEGSARLVEVPNLLACSTAGGAAYRLHFPGGYLLEIASGFRANELHTLAEVIHSL